MKKVTALLAGVAALAALSMPAQAVVIDDLGINPTSAAGHFSNDPLGPGLGGLFYDQYTFQLIGGPQFITVASATNTFASGGIGGPFGITSFAGAIYEIVGAIDAAPGGNDILRFGPQFASLCNSGLCQTLDGVGLLNPGNYYLAISGNAGTLAGYGGDLSVAAVPIPAVGTGIPGIIGAVGGLIYWAKKRRAKKQNQLSNLATA